MTSNREYDRMLQARMNKDREAFLKKYMEREERE
jgi:hypothetical protein